MPVIKPLRPALQQAFLDCHSEGHQWVHMKGTVDPALAEPGMRAPLDMRTAIGRRSTCSSCGCERVRWYTRSGEVVNRYRYLDGYLHQRTTEDDYAPSRLEWRQRLVTQLFDELEPKRKRA